MIKFLCKNCGQKISVPEIHAGKKGKCPKCKSIVVVPKIGFSGSVKEQRSPAASKQDNSSPPVSDIQLKKEPPSQTGKPDKVFSNGFGVMHGHEQVIKMEEAEKPSVRRVPWILDIFLYPTSMKGVIYLVIFPMVICPLLLLVLFSPRRGLFLFLLCIVVGYVLYYLADCVRESTTGEIRASDDMTQSIILDKWDCIEQVIHVLACVSICFGAVTVYFFITKRLDWIFWLLAISGVMIFPMTLLSVVMFDSFSGLNPILIISSIISTIFEYLGLLVMFYGLGILVILMLRLLPLSIITVYIAITMVLYFAMVACHLLGRFYYLNSKKLNWEV